MKANMLIFMSLFIASFASAQDQSTDKSMQPEQIEDNVQTSQSATSQQASNQSQTNLALTGGLQSGKKFGAFVRLTAETDLKEDTSTEKVYGSGVDLFLSYQLNSQYNANLWLRATKNFSQGYDESLGNTSLRISKKPYQINKKLVFIPSAAVIHPTSKVSKVRDDMILGTDISGVLSYQATNNLSLTYISRPRKNFHEYEVNRVGRTNTSFQYSHLLIGSYSFTDKFSLNPIVILTNSWSYSGRRKDDGFLALIEGSYFYNKKYSFSAGLMNSGAIQNREKGKDQNIELYNANSSSVYGQVDIRF